jgi:hypothetical protein
MANMISIFNLLQYLPHPPPAMGGGLGPPKQKKSMFNTLDTRGSEAPTTDVDVKVALSPQ